MVERVARFRYDFSSRPITAGRVFLHIHGSSLLVRCRERMSARGFSSRFDERYRVHIHTQVATFEAVALVGRFETELHVLERAKVDDREDEFMRVHVDTHVRARKLDVNAGLTRRDSEANDAYL